MTPANYGTRAIAFLIDLAFAIGPGLAGIFCGVAALFSDGTRIFGIVLIVGGGFWILTAWAYNDIWRQGRTGATVGKKRMGIALVKTATGEPVGVGLALIRWGAVWFFNSLSFGLYILADLLAPAFTDKRQRITDKMLSAEVVDRSSDSVGLPPPMPPAEYTW